MEDTLTRTELIEKISIGLEQLLLSDDHTEDDKEAIAQELLKMLKEEF